MALEALETKCCPLCDRPWTPDSRIRVVDNFVYWEGKMVEWYESHSRRIVSGITAQVFILLYNERGKRVSREKLYDALYADREDGGPDTKILDVYLCRVRSTIRRYGMPFKITTLHANNFASPLGGGYLLTVIGSENASP